MVLVYPAEHAFHFGSEKKRPGINVPSTKQPVFASPRSPPAGPLQNVTPDVYLTIKLRLIARLQNFALSNIPGGFPFQYSSDRNGSASISYGPYEFEETISVSSHWDSRQDHTVLFSYRPPSRAPGQERYTWCISLPTISSKPSRSIRAPYAPTPTISAQVTMDPAITRSRYFSKIQASDRVILRALTISLEFSVAIDICLVDAEMVGYLSGALEMGDIAYLGTSTQGARQLLYGIDAHSLEVKYSVLPSAKT